MDLNDALHSCRCGGHIRDDANMTPEWTIYFRSDATTENCNRAPHERTGEFFYINPKTGPAHRVRFSDAMKASCQWRTVPHLDPKTLERK